jgi:hypothetical protein
MWRSTLLTAAVVLGAQSVYAQAPPYPPAGTTGLPIVPPPAPITTAPAGPNPGVPGPPLANAVGVRLESTTAFDTNQADLRWQDGRWQLYSGTTFLKDFGRSEAEGREVLRVVRQLHLNTVTTLGSPRPIMEYWLTNGTAPQGTIAGLRTLAIDPAALSADQVQGQWCVHDASRILFNFGQQADACRMALAAIQHYGFTQVGYVGQSAPVMLLFLANTPATAVNPLTPPAVTATNPNRLSDTRLAQMTGRQPQPGGNGNVPNPQVTQPQPSAMPGVPSQQMPQPGANPAPGPGGLAQAGLRIPGTEAADRVAIDPRQLQLRHDGNDWKLAMGNHIIANFGANEADAQLARAALGYYQCTEQIYVGNPRPVFSYFLAHGQAPHGVIYATNGIAFRPEALAVRQLGSSYVLYDGQQVIMNFGDRMAEAQQTLQAIQQHKFDRLTTFGRGDQSMTMFVKTN